MFIQLPAHACQSVTLSWDPSSDTNVAGFKIYYGTTSQNYPNVVVAGNTNSVTITGLKAGTTYYFAATSYNAAGTESALSNEASYAVPGIAATLTSASSANGQFSFTVTGTAGQQYVVQASTDLVNWVSVQTNAAPFVFVDPDAASFNQRFYRTFTLSP